MSPTAAARLPSAAVVAAAAGAGAREVVICEALFDCPAHPEMATSVMAARSRWSHVFDIIIRYFPSPTTRRRGWCSAATA